MNDYTVKDISKLLGVSKTTVQKYIRAESVQYDYIERNKQFYSYSKAKEIIKAIRPDFDFSALEVDNQVENSTTKTENQLENSTTKIANSAADVANSESKTENSTDKLDNSTTKTENSETNAEITSRMLDMLQDELNKKDQEIKELREKLDKAYDRIADMANKAQYITAADKTALIMDKQSQTENSEVVEAVSEDTVKPIKKSWWQKLWGK